MQGKRPVQMEFHVSRLCRDRYGFDQNLFALAGNVVFTNFHAARIFAQKMNARRNLAAFPEQAVRAGHLNAMGLVDEILHFVIAQYRQQINPQMGQQALAWLGEQLGAESLDATLRQFTEEFPPTAVYRGELSLDEYLAGSSVLPDGNEVSNRQLALEELLMLWMANMNPAFSPYLELFEDENLEQMTAYRNLIRSLHAFFDTQPPFGPEKLNLIDLLRLPAITHPHSLAAQLEFMRSRWFQLLGKYLYRLLSSLDLIKEEERMIFGFGGQGAAEVIEFKGQEIESERFSPDREWMPKVVLIAKNSYVWLDQLSKKYRRPITRLDQIPGEELDYLAWAGITGLWLIGLWERSPASQRIKQLRGNPEAVASAYSLYSYEIAADLGGESAYQSLRETAWQRGIRLASDMVPNHMGIDSPWVIEHPDWFISLDYPPFPSYTFNGPNLSSDGRVSIFIEDHYFDNTDAAVVFKRRDNSTGSEKYLYHGNDGTSMPWNDTAQLNYLLPEVREAVIQTILHVARKFPIIRFDAAMTLAKKHYQRLWYPEPGSGGDIPSRAGQGMTREEFDRLFPQEFWREVVDRVAAEVPDTLLLAEAFWLMEGYFVRTLGMHRVYNSAFMNMLRDEKNQEYRLTIKNTLEFEPEILKRYVNFMNNPDERTAADQFGKGDKYFGVAILMSTMPGLPMIGHGQIEGYTEKYGMEFHRAYWDERPDPSLVERHEREVFPLLRKRYLFAGVQNFFLYDFFSEGGVVNEDVFAYSNRSGEERALVLYHNRYAAARGWIRTSSAYAVKRGEERSLEQNTLGAGLALPDDPQAYVIFRDTLRGLEYLRNCREIHEKGLFFELGAYQCRVFLDFRVVQDDPWRHYAQLHDFLDGRGVPAMEEALREIFLQPVRGPAQELINPGFFHWLVQNRRRPGKPEPPESDEDYRKALEEARQKYLDLLFKAREFTGGSGDPEKLAGEIQEEVAAALDLPVLAQRFARPRSRKFRDALGYLNGGQDLAAGDPPAWGTLFGALFTRKLARVLAPEADRELVNEQSRTWIDEWLLGKILAQTLQEMGVEESRAWRQVNLIKLLAVYQDWPAQEGDEPEKALALLRKWMEDPEFQSFIGVNRFQDVLWFNQEAYEEALWWLFALAAVDEVSGAEVENPLEGIKKNYLLVRRLLEAGRASQYQVEGLIEAIQASPLPNRREG